MEHKKLTPDQLIVIVRALLGAEPYLFRPESIVVDIAITTFTSFYNGSDGTIAITSDMHITKTDTRTEERGSDSYQLYIGYYDKVHETNPAVIGFGYFDGDELRPLVLNNLTFVVDKLREFGIW